MTGYTRNDTTNNIANGNVINAADLDGEFDAIQSAFDASTGHAHDGTVGGGAPIEALGPAQDVVITTSVLRPKTDNTVDLGTSTLEFKDLYLDGTAKVDTLTVDESATITANLTVNGNTTLGNAATDTVTVTADVASHLIPATDNTYDLGGASDEWRNLYIDGTAQVDTLQVDESATITANLTVNGNTTLGNATTDTLTLTAQLATSVLPSTDDAVDLGSSSKEWRNLYVDGTANIDTLVADTATISAGTATLSAGTIITSTGGTLTLQRDDTAITTGETLGEIDFQAPNVSGGGDAVVVAATIRAVARDTFDAAVNKTSLLFQTASSGAVATRMEIEGTGNVAVDTDTLYVDAVNDRVGINNASPTVALDVTGAATVSGVITASSDVSIADKIIHTGDTNTAIRFPSADTVTVETSGAERLRVDSSGNVGIGTNSPGYELDVQGATDPSIRVRATGTGVSDDSLLRLQIAGTTASNYIQFGDSADSDAGYIKYDHTSDSLAVGVNAAERMRIDSSGNVGIGTNSPSTYGGKLAIVGAALGGETTLVLSNTNTSQFLRMGINADVAQIAYDNADALAFGIANSSTDAGLTTEYMRIDSSGSVGIGTTSPQRQLHLASSVPSIRLEDTDVSGLYAEVVQLSGGDLSIRADHGNVQASTSISFSLDASERMRIDSSGNVLIGTPTSVSNNKLVIEQASGDGANSGFLMQRNGAAGTSFKIDIDSSDVANFRRGVINAMSIDSSGKVGIGTSSPAEELHIQAAAPTLRLQDSDDSAYTNFIHNAGGFRIDVDPTAAGASSFFRVDVDGSERMRIDSSGNVGIGTSSPATMLELSANNNAGTALNVLRFSDTDATTATGQQTGAIEFYVNDASVGGSGVGSFIIGSAAGTSGGGQLLFGTSANAATGASEVARIDSSGNLLVGKTTTAFGTQGTRIGTDGVLTLTRDAATSLFINRLTNDGNLVEFSQATVTEGSISVSGTTVSYNGGHLSRWAQFPDNSRPELLKGTVMSNLDQMSSWGEEENEQLNCVQVSTVEGDPDVAGVFVAWDSTDDGYNDILLAMTGDMVIRIGAGVTVARGDLLMSAGDGTAKPQGDDIVRSKTIAKVTSTHVSHTYADGSYAVPCVLMAC